MEMTLKIININYATKTTNKTRFKKKQKQKQNLRDLRDKTKYLAFVSTESQKVRRKNMI